MKMKVEDVLSCSFSSWYHQFEDITDKSVIIPVPSYFLDYLHTDGVVLPESSTHGTHKNAANIAMDGDEDDPEIRDDELMKMYEDDWSVPNSSKETPTSQAPEFGEFETQIKDAIKLLGGQVFPKLNWSSPKDASWISFDKSLLCTCPCDVYLLLKSSQFIGHDLDMPFSHCEDVHSCPPFSYDLVLRKWHPPHPASEFRCFVHERIIVGICQRNVDKFYEMIGQEKDSIVKDISTFFTKKVVDSFSATNYVFDVVRLKTGSVKLVDFNPWGPVTDSLLFAWEDLGNLKPSPNTQVPEFRCVETEEGVMSSTHAMYAFPQDVVDLAAGEDPFKLLDLMNLKIQNPQGPDSNSSDDET